VFWHVGAGAGYDSYGGGYDAYGYGADESYYGYEDYGSYDYYGGDVGYGYGGGYAAPAPIQPAAFGRGRGAIGGGVSFSVIYVSCLSILVIYV